MDLSPHWVCSAHMGADVGATTDLARRIAQYLRPGDTLLLDGELGSGKTHFARGVIQACLGATHAVIDIPSPTFTLVQTYDAPCGEIWHADLYRLSEWQEILELGLDLAMDTAICMIEWPVRAGIVWPDSAVCVRFDTPLNAPDTRDLSLWGAPDAPLLGRITRAFAML